MYTPDLVTLNAVRSHRSLADVETNDDALLKRLISEASADFQSAIRRTAMPYHAAIGVDFARQYVKTGNRLTVGEDLLELTAITNGNGEAISVNDVALLPTNGYPKFGVVALETSWTSGTRGPWGAITLTGWWGYAPHYAAAWRHIGDVPAGNLSSSATELTITNAAITYEVGQYWRLEDEIVQVTAIDTNTVTIRRGELGTTAAAHVAGVDIEVYQQLADIAGAVRDMVAYKYKAKDRIGGRVTVFDNGAVTVEDLDPSVGAAINRHIRRTLGTRS